MGFGKGFPEIRVTRAGPRMNRVLWEDSTADSDRVFDMTGMHITKVETVIEPGSIPIVQVSFIARLVEVDELTSAATVTSAASPPDRGISTTRLNPVAEQLAREFPLLWGKALGADFRERSGYSPEPLSVEADRVMHEIWMTRMAAREA